MNIPAILLVLLAGVNSCVGNLLLKWSRTATAADAGTVEKLLSPGFIGGLFFYAVNVVLFAKALDHMQVSVAYPILAGFGFALLVLASWAIFHEPITVSKIAGIGLVLAGIVTLAQPG